MIIGSAIPKYDQFFSREDSSRFNPVTTWYWGYGGQEQVLVSSTGTPIISSQHERPRDEIISSRINSHRGTMIRQPDISIWSTLNRIIACLTLPIHMTSIKQLHHVHNCKYFSLRNSRAMFFLSLLTFHSEFSLNVGDWSSQWRNDQN